jgi:1-acyl-sn-glycerol-3-phosphate acyltransferase
MRKPTFHPLAARCFESVFIPMRNFRLGGIEIVNLPGSLPEGRPVVLVGNHVSNWDGFIFRETQRRIRPRWPIYSLMLEAELRRYPIIRLLGGIGIEPGSAASVAGALRAARGLRREGADFFFSYFPQGRIFPSFKRPLGFRAGLDLFLQALAPATVIPAALHVEPMKKLAPTFFVSLGRPIATDGPHAGPFHRLCEERVEEEIDRLHARLALHGEDADPSGRSPDAAAAGAHPVRGTGHGAGRA